MNTLLLRSATLLALAAAALGASAQTRYRVTELGTFGGFVSGYGVNDSGQVAGIATTAGGNHRAFLSAPNGGALKDLGTLGLDSSEGYGVNASGQVTGYSSTAGNEIHAFLSAPDGGALTDLGTLGGNLSVGRGVNRLGQVVGASAMAGNEIHAFLSAPNGGALTDLGTLGGDLSDGYAVNAVGEAVGFSRLDGGDEHAFLYTATGGMRDLNALLDASGAGWTLEAAYGISDRGFITGYGTIDGEPRAFLLTPVPEPASLALGTIALARRRRLVA